jgi:hypothetical protein
MLSLAMLIGAAYVTKKDVDDVKDGVKELKATVDKNHEIRLIKLEQFVIDFSDMKHDIKEMNRLISVTVARMRRDEGRDGNGQ